MNFALVRRMAMRDVRSGEMGLLLAALVVAVGTVTSISLFVDRLHQALLDESANFLAADPDNGGQYILAQRSPSGGPLLPILQRGVKCRVRQRQNGLWRRAR